MQEKVLRVKCIVKKDETATVAILFGATDQGMETIQNVVNKYSQEKVILDEYEN